MNTEEIKEWFENQNYLPVMLQKDWKDTILKENIYTERMIIELLKEFSERFKNTETSDNNKAKQLKILGVSNRCSKQKIISILEDRKHFFKPKGYYKNNIKKLTEAIKTIKELVPNF